MFLIICALSLLNSTYATFVDIPSIETTIIASGICGDNLVWELEDTGLLKIKGTGRMYDFDVPSSSPVEPETETKEDNPPWEDYANDIESILVDQDVTYIGKNAFSWTSVKYFSMGDDLEEIGDFAFYKTNLYHFEAYDKLRKIGTLAFSNCFSLSSVNLNDGLEYIASSAFSDCFELKTITIPDSVKYIGDYAFSETKLLVGYDSYAYEYSVLNGCEYEITSIPLSKVTINYEKTVQYTGQAIKPAVTLSLDGKNLIYKTDYELLYKNNVNVGIATITIVGKGTYKGSVTKNFKIVKVLPFKDVAKESYYYSSVDYCYNNNIILGTTDTTFSPSKKLSRGQLVTMLWRMEGSPIVKTANKFLDLKDSEYYYNAVLWASSKRIVNGYSDGKFLANNNITREQLATILRNYAVYKKKNVNVNVNLSKFTDSTGVSSYAKEGVEWAIANKIISGKNNGTKIDPRGNASRAEIAVMITNYCNYVGR